MKRLFTIFVMTLLFHGMFLFVSCGESSTERAQREKIDSLENVSYQNKMNYEDLQRYLYVIAEGLDSISIEEKEMFLKNGDIEGRGLNRKRIQQNLAHVRDILSRHRERIAELEQKLEDGDETHRQLRTIITALRQQLDAKDKELAQLKADLETNKKSITALSEQIKHLDQEKENQAQTIQEQKELIKEQNDKLNNVYVKIGSKKELKKLGLLSSGLFKKAKVKYDNIDLSLFQQVDRSLNNISLPKKVKILTPVPTGSYEIVDNTKTGGKMLVVTDSIKFWSLSKFLIIQTD